MTEENKNIYKQIQEAINSLPDNFSILEEKVDVELQMQYFNYSKDLKREFSAEYILDRMDDLFKEEVSIDEKKNLLVLLASVSEVEAYRSIELFAKDPVPELKDWSILALQESRMLMQSTLLDEQQVFISTGLGGKGQDLRYFVVLRSHNYEIEFTEVQKQLVESELKFVIEKYEGIFEEINFEEGFANAFILMPLKSDLQEMFKALTDEVNQYGNFLSEDVIITNVRKMTMEEIKQFLESNKNNEGDDSNE